MELGSLGLDSMVLQELRTRALHLVHSSRVPKRCLQVMRARVAAFSDSGILGGVGREKFMEEGRGCVVLCPGDGCVEESAPVPVQMPLSEDELFEEGYNDLKGPKMMMEVQAQDLEEIQNGEFTDGQVVQDVMQPETQDVKEMVSEEFQFCAVQMYSTVILMNQAYKKDWRIEMAFRNYVKCCCTKGLMYVQGQSFLSCAIPGHINLQPNTTQKVKMKKCITQRVKMKMFLVVDMLAIDKLVVWQELALLLYTDSIQLRMILSEKESAKSGRGRSRGRSGRGAYMPRKRSSRVENANGKEEGKEHEESRAIKKLDLEYEGQKDKGDGDLVASGSTPLMPPPHVSPREQKKQRKLASPKKPENLATSAASLVEDRRA